jgi:hypothetical protein
MARVRNWYCAILRKNSTFFSGMAVLEQRSNLRALPTKILSTNQPLYMLVEREREREKKKHVVQNRPTYI